MYIKRLKLKNFRNYENEELHFSPLTNIIYGNNAQGKTNILEAVHLFSQGRSHRTKSDGELVRFGCDFANLEIEFSDKNREYTAQIRILDNGRKAVMVNHIAISRLSEMMNYLNVVMFSPEDLDLVKGSPQVRRRFIDSAISQLYPSYLASLTEYKKILKQKTSLLKAIKYNGQSDATLCVWNSELARLMVKLIAMRKGFIESINEKAEKIQNEISGEKLSVSYHPNIRNTDAAEEEICEFLESRKSREIELAMAYYGIQRDDFDIFIDGKDAKLFASQGQQRTAALSIKIAQSEYINEIKGEYPILLLDDIMSELDESRRMYLSERIDDKQVLITSTDTDLSGRDTQTKLFKIDKGRVVGKE